MLFHMLKTGDMVILRQKRENMLMQARRQPERLKFPRRGEQMVVQDNVICSIPDGATALYMGSHTDPLREALKRKVGPYGMVAGTIVYHFVFWNGMHAWVSSEDAELERVT